MLDVQRTWTRGRAVRNVAILGLALFLAAAALAGGSSARAAEPLRIAVLKFGTVNWELDVIRHYGLDRSNGVDLQVQPVAGSAAARVAFEGAAVDVIVSDWIWVARRRAAGADYRFIPYSRSVGGMMVAGDSPARDLSDLKGARIGIAGGPVDKSWLILQALARMQGFDLKAETEQVFGAPPLIYQKALSGEIDAVINFWHFMAKLEARGFRTVVSTAQAAEALGLDPDVPLLGYVVRGELLETRPELARGLAAASRAAKTILAESDAEWDRLRPLMKAQSDAEFERLKAGFRAGIPNGSPVDAAQAARMFALMAELGGETLTGEATTLPEDVFLNPED